MMRDGVSSTVTGAIRSVKSALVVSGVAALDCMAGMPGCGCDISNLPAPHSMAAMPLNFTKPLRFTIPSSLGSADVAKQHNPGCRKQILSWRYDGYKTTPRQDLTLRRLASSRG